MHGTEQLDTGRVSDVDIVVSIPAEEIIRDSREEFAKEGLYPVVATEYDLGGTRGSWYCTYDASDGVQLDFLYDEVGLGRQGLASPGLLSLATRTYHDIPVISYAAELVYLWRKGVWKRQGDRLDELAQASKLLDPNELKRASVLITHSERTADELLLGRKPLSPHLQTVRHPILRARRLAHRIRKPAGFWVHTFDKSPALAIAQRFDRFLPRTDTGLVPNNTAAEIAWFYHRVQPVRLRPGVFASFGPIPGGSKPDICLSGRSVGDGSIDVVEAMTRRFCT